MITVELEAGTVTLPHPANFALHKLLVLARRPSEAKRDKDREAALRILKALSDKGQDRIVAQVFRSLPKKWQGKIKKALAGSGQLTAEDFFAWLPDTPK